MDGRRCPAHCGSTHSDDAGTFGKSNHRPLATITTIAVSRSATRTTVSATPNYRRKTSFILILLVFLFSTETHPAMAARWTRESNSHLYINILSHFLAPQHGLALHNGQLSIPAQLGRPTASQRREINRIGDKYGCHTCGTQESGRASGNWAGDHQPVTRFLRPGEQQRFYPHCAQCSAKQGGDVSTMLRRFTPFQDQ